MKKTIIILIALLNAISLFTACGGGGDNLYEESNYDNVSVYKPEESKTEVENVSSAPLAGEFTVKDKVYEFRGNNIAIVSVKNGTNKDYSVTVKGKYLDKDGNVLKEETQTLDQYSAGYENYFLFEPNIAFDKFTYEFETTETDGPFLAKDLGFKYNGLNYAPFNIDSLVQQDDFTRYPSVNADLRYEYLTDVPASFYVRWVIMSADGEIMALYTDVLRCDEVWHFEDGWRPFPMYQTTDNDWKHPEEWKKFSAICVMKKASTDKNNTSWGTIAPDVPIEGSMQ